MDSVLKEYDVWISGLRKGQSKHRAGLNKEEQSKDGILKYYPILDWDISEIWAYKKEFNLPDHPLDAKGYSSIGCEPCTRSVVDGRGGRWFGQSKTECGLHLS